MPSSDVVAVVGAVVGVANLILNLRLQVQTLRFKRWVESVMAAHLEDYHGVKGPRAAAGWGTHE